MADSQKTEKATPKKRRDERKKGNVFFSSDAVAVVTLLGGFLTLWVWAPRMVEELYDFLRVCLSLAARQPDSPALDLGEVFGQFLTALCWAAGPLLAAAAVTVLEILLFWLHFRRREVKL